MAAKRAASEKVIHYHLILLYRFYCYLT